MNVTFDRPGWSYEILKALHVFHQQEEYCDVVVVCNDKKIRAHSCVLAAASPWVASELQCGSSEGPVQIVSLEDTPSQVVQYIMTFVYTGQFKVPLKHIKEAQSLASRLGIRCLKDRNEDDDGSGDEGSHGDHGNNHGNSPPRDIPARARGAGRRASDLEHRVPDSSLPSDTVVTLNRDWCEADSTPSASQSDSTPSVSQSTSLTLPSSSTPDTGYPTPSLSQTPLPGTSRSSRLKRAAQDHEDIKPDTPPKRRSLRATPRSYREDSTSPEPEGRMHEKDAEIEEDTEIKNVYRQTLKEQVAAGDMEALEKLENIRQQGKARSKKYRDKQKNEIKSESRNKTNEESPGSAEKISLTESEKEEQREYWRQKQRESRARKMAVFTMGGGWEMVQRIRERSNLGLGGEEVCGEMEEQMESWSQKGPRRGRGTGRGRGRGVMRRSLEKSNSEGGDVLGDKEEQREYWRQKQRESRARKQAQRMSCGYDAQEMPIPHMTDELYTYIPPQILAALPPESDTTLPLESDTALPPESTLHPESDASFPPETDTTLPPESDTTLPPESDTTLHPESDTTLPPRSDTDVPLESDTTLPPESDTTSSPEPDAAIPSFTDHYNITLND